MTLESGLLKQIISLGDFDTWNHLKQHYFPEGEYQKLWSIVDKHVNKYHELPTFEQLKLEIRSRELQEKIYAIEAVDTDIEPHILLDYLKNQFTQNEILARIENYVEQTIAISDAKENIDLLQEIVVQVEDRVDVNDEADNMNYVELFDDEDDLKKHLPLGLNQDYDISFTFSPKDLVVVGGYRGGGKSFTCCNMAVSAHERGRSVLYFTIEMDSRAILQRMCAMATGVPISRLSRRKLFDKEWDLVAEWWANRFENGGMHLANFSKHRDFDKFHRELTRNKLTSGAQIDVHYDPGLTLSKIVNIVRQKRLQLPDLGLIIVDYLNQVKRHNAPSRSGQYDWTEQIEISKGLKQLAQEEKCLIVSAFQTSEKGEVRFSKGILDAVDAAYSIQHWGDQEQCIKFVCTKMRNGKVEGFTSTMNWESLKIGPQTAIDPDERAELKETMETGESTYDL